MSDKRKPPGGPNSAGVRKCFVPQLTKPRLFPQHPLLWQAYRECFQRFQDDPSPVNRLIAQILGERWNQANKAEQLR